MAVIPNDRPTGEKTLITRRHLLLRTAPACGVACLGLGIPGGLAGAVPRPDTQEQHKFDVPLDPPPPPTAPVSLSPPSGSGTGRSS